MLLYIRSLLQEEQCTEGETGKGKRSHMLASPPRGHFPHQPGLPHATSGASAHTLDVVCSLWAWMLSVSHLPSLPHITGIYLALSHLIALGLNDSGKGREGVEEKGEESALGRFSMGD